MREIVDVYCWYSSDKSISDRDRSRLLLKRVLGVVSARQLVFGDHWKPYLKDGPFFSLSDEDGLSVLAVCKKEIGADIHQIGVWDEAVVRRYFTAEEYKNFMDAPEEERPIIFGKLWSRTEASLKCIGTGLDLDFRKHRDMIDHLYIASADLPGGYILSCACEEKIDLNIIILSDDDIGSEK